jgi:hypothetical protein
MIIKLCVLCAVCVSNNKNPENTPEPTQKAEKVWCFPAAGHSPLNRTNMAASKQSKLLYAAVARGTIVLAEHRYAKRKRAPLLLTVFGACAARCA